MKVALATLCLNEMEWLEKLYEQHKNWPGLERWVFVESADRVYAETNPDMVFAGGLSVDGTSKFLRDLAERDSRVIYIPYGLSRHDDSAQGKCAARNQYLEVLEGVKPDFFVALDADEFYTHDDQHRVNRIVKQSPVSHGGFAFKWSCVWRPPSIANEPLFALEAVGGVWSVPACRTWRWSPGMTYRNNHNTPCDTRGNPLDRNLLRRDKTSASPCCVHMGYCSSLKTRKAKHAYYVARGEGVKDGRQKYVTCRAAFETWKPGYPLPHGSKVVPYEGPIPEVFQKDPVMSPEYWRGRLVKFQGDRYRAIFDGGEEDWKEVMEDQKLTLATAVSPTESVIDVGCGWGRLLELLPKEWCGSYLGVDVSPEFIEIAKELYPERDFRVCDARNLEGIDDGQFDVAVVVWIEKMIRRHIGDEVWEQFEKELKRVAKRVLIVSSGMHD